MLCTHWDLRTALVQRRKTGLSLGHRGRIRTRAHQIPKLTDGFPQDGCDNKVVGEGSRKALCAPPGKTLELRSAMAGVVLFMDCLS